jgi:hypothetical protein
VYIRITWGSLKWKLEICVAVTACTQPCWLRCLARRVRVQGSNPTKSKNELHGQREQVKQEFIDIEIKKYKAGELSPQSWEGRVPKEDAQQVTWSKAFIHFFKGIA